MSWKSFGNCDKCGRENVRLFPTFGKSICEKCKTDRPRKGFGNAGLSNSGITDKIATDELSLIRVKKSDGLFGKLFFEHYPNSKGIPGRSLCYLISYNKKFIGIIGANSPPRNYGIFEEFFGVGYEENFVNNNVFRIIETEKNLGTRILSLFRKRIKVDYEEKYKQKLIGIVTFVEPPRTGSVYKADNWIFLGETRGRQGKRDSITWERVFTDGSKKLIFGYKYKQEKIR